MSHVSQIIANPAGEHTRLRIDTYTGHGVLKSFGGDSIRVSFRGPDVVSAAVFDLQNGSYDALALLVTPGEYGVEIILDYSQCNGFKDPPSEWYIKGRILLFWCQYSDSCRSIMISERVDTDKKMFSIFFL